MDLVQPYKGVFLRALEKRFNYATLSVLITQNTQWDYDNLANKYEPWPLQAVAVYEHFRMHNRVEELAALTRDARPAEPAFAKVADSLGFAVLPDPAQVAEVSQLLGLPAAPANGLEAVVRKSGNPYLDVEVFRAQVATLEQHVCQVRATLAGTGTLIGPKLVLTNRHVVGPILSADNVLSGPVACVFDKKRAASGFETPEAEYKVARVLAASPHVKADEKKGPMQEAPGSLDYVLLELTEAIDEIPVVQTGEPRGHLALKTDVTAPAQFAGLLVLQHPADEPMKIDIGAVMQAGNTRMRHSVNTKKGSSGAPVFDANLNLVAIHHAGHLDWPQANLGYNQAIPIAAIIADARAKNVPI